MTITYASIETMRLKGERYRVFLNGAEVRRALEADVSAGEVLKYKEDAAGKFILRPDMSGCETERLCGRVRIEKIE